MSNRDWYVKIICVLLGMIVGSLATIGCWYYKHANAPAEITVENPKIVEAEKKEFNAENFWEKASLYYEDELGVFMNNYESVYSSYSLGNYMDNSLETYYEEYGYGAVICSGLESGNKMAQVYCIEKCCEIIGDEEMNTDAVMKSLNKVIIDKEKYTDSEFEEDYIQRAGDRLELAKALVSGKNKSENLFRNPKGDRMAWVSNMLYGSEEIRLLENEAYYTVPVDSFLYNTEIAFVTDNILEMKNEEYGLSIKTICFNEKITVSDINECLYMHFNRESIYIDEIRNVSYAGTKLEGECVVRDGAEASKDGVYKFVIDAKDGTVINAEEVKTV